MSNRIIQSYRYWRKYRETYRALARLSTHQLQDLGIETADIAVVSRRVASA
jgi:uncharacterized protein YjiS (DUF1127 family)